MVPFCMIIFLKTIVKIIKIYSSKTPYFMFEKQIIIIIIIVKHSFSKTVFKVFISHFNFLYEVEFISRLMVRINSTSCCLKISKVAMAFH